jgi:hypothetical protein
MVIAEMGGNVPTKMQCQVYALDSSAGLTAKRVASLPNITTAYTTLLPLSLGGRTYLLGHSKGNAKLDVFQFLPKGPKLKRLPGGPQIAAGADILETFTLGNRPYLVAYVAKTGVFNIYSIGNNLALSKPLLFFRNHELALSQGFATVKSFSLFGEVAFLGYRNDTGYVAMYTLVMTSTSPDDTPPLRVDPVWSHQWAKGWTRFAFFQLGGENFFFKTNTWKPNVNIDHVSDDPSAGTVEVGTEMDPDRAMQSVDIVQPVTVNNGDPYFIAYKKKSGELTLNRIHGDCLGWTKSDTVAAKANAGQVVPLAVAPDKNFLLVV